MSSSSATAVSATPSGATGEIAFRSHALTAGTWVRASRRTTVFDDGWFRTGDLGHLDDAGNLFVTGRTKLFISTSGFKVDPFEVETVLRAPAGCRRRRRGRRPG